MYSEKKKKKKKRKKQVHYKQKDKVSIKYCINYLRCCDSVFCM